MNYNSLKATINANIKQNGNQEITGDVLNSVLNAMVNALASAGATFGGVIDPTSSAPVSLDQATIYLALTPGEYNHFVDEDSEPIVVDGIALIQYDGDGTLKFSKTELKPWQMTIAPDAGNDYIGIFVPNGGCTLAVDSVGFHGMICITNVYGISSATFVGSGGINTSVNVESGRMNTTPVVVLKSNNDAPITITCVAGNAPNGAIGTDEIIITPIATKAWTELGAGGGSNVFWAEYGVTTYQQIVDAYNAGKLVACRYNNNNYTLTTLSFGGSAWFGGTMGQTYRLRCNINDSSWGADTFYAENSSNRQNSIPTNPDNYHYLSTKAVADALGKYGVISQVQTWSGSSSTGYAYEMSGQVYGIIPQSFIDAVTNAGAVFNSETGYFKLNDLTDISYQEMITIYNYFLFLDAYQQGDAHIPARTLFPGAKAPTLVSSWGRYFTKVETLRITKTFDYVNLTNGQVTYLFYTGVSYIRKIITQIRCQANTTFGVGAWGDMFSLETLYLYNLHSNISFASSPKLSPASVSYMINNAGTATFTITLHATAYAAAIADADVQAALSAHTNVSLASA